MDPFFIISHRVFALFQELTVLRWLGPVLGVVWLGHFLRPPCLRNGANYREGALLIICTRPRTGLSRLICLSKTRFLYFSWNHYRYCVWRDGCCAHCTNLGPWNCMWYRLLFDVFLWKEFRQWVNRCLRRCSVLMRLLNASVSVLWVNVWCVSQRCRCTPVLGSAHKAPFTQVD